MAAPSKTLKQWLIAFGSGAIGAALVAWLASIGAITISPEPTTTTTAVTTTITQATTTARPTTMKPTTTLAPTTTTTPPATGIGAPAGTGLNVPIGTVLKQWPGPYTITPTTHGVVNGRIEGYLFTQRTTVSGNVAFVNDKWMFEDYSHLVVTGTATPGPTFTHVEVDGLKSQSHPDDIGVTNSTHDNGMTLGVSVSAFTITDSHIYGLGNGMRLDSGAKVINTLIDGDSVVGGSHTDGVEIYCGHDISIDHATIIMSDPSSNGADEAQGSTNGGFCPVNNLSFSNSFFSGGTGTMRFDDQFVTHISVTNMVIAAGKSYYWYATAHNPENVDVWTNVKLSDGTVLPKPSGGGWAFGCGGVHVSCH